MTQVSHFITLCFFLQKNQQMPQPRYLLSASLITHFFLGLMILALLVDPVEASIQISVKMLFSVFFVLTAVIFARKFKKFVPTVTAIIMCENLIAIIGLPLVIWMQFAEEMVFLPFYLSLTLLLWGGAVAGFIFRQSFSMKTGTTLIVAFMYFMIANLGSYLFVTT